MKLQDNLALLPTAAVAVVLEFGALASYASFHEANGFLRLRGDLFLLAAQGYVIVACILVYFWGVYWTEPFGDIFEGIAAFGRGNFAHRIRRSKVRELDELAGHLNQMSDRLREVDQLKSDLISNVSHELRSPLAAMEGYIALLLRQAPDPSQTRENLLKIGGNITRLRRLVENLLDLSKIESQGTSLHLERVKALDIVHETCFLFETALKNKNLSLTIDCPEGIPDTKADPAKLRQIMTNLLDNAIKYNRLSGFVKISAFSGRAEPRIVTLSIQDSGCGILPEHMPHLFERFRRLPGSANAPEVKGTGLGLAISLELARSMGGDIQVESRPENGSVFSLILPAWEGD